MAKADGAMEVVVLIALVQVVAVIAALWSRFLHVVIGVGLASCIAAVAVVGFRRGCFGLGSCRSSCY